MRASLPTMKSRPTATPESITRMSSAAISVNPCEPFCFCLIGKSPRPKKTLLIAIAKRHILRTDVRGQKHTLGLVAIGDDALPHDHEIDLLDQVRRLPCAEGICLIGVEY